MNKILSLEEWTHEIIKNDTFSEITPNLILDFQGLTYLNDSDNKLLLGFMSKPVIEIDGLVYVTKNRIMNNLDDINIITEPFVIYNLFFVPNIPNYYYLDEKTQLPTKLEKPIITTNYGVWRISYAIGETKGK